MRKDLLKSICLGVMLSTLIACSNDIQVELEKSALNHGTKTEEMLELVEMVDGVLKFRDADALSDAMINSEIVSTTKLKSNNFKSLGSKYAKLEKSYDLMVVNKGVEGRVSSIDDFIEIEDIIENPVRSRVLADFLNEDGMMIIGDLAVKVIGDYAYSTSLDSFKQLSQLTEKELKSSKNIAVERIIIPMVSNDDSAIQTKGSSGGTYERSFVFIPTNNSKRREHVKFNPYLFVVKNAQTEIVIEMEGRAQTKQIFGIWGGTFSDEMVWGEIHINSGSWWYNQPPVPPADPALHFPQGTNYLPTGLVARVNNGSICKYGKKLGITGGVSSVKANVTFKTKKNNYQPSNWQSEYTNNYTSITK